MTRSTLVAGALVFAVSVAGATASLAQSGRFTLGSGSGAPGHSIGLPIYLTLPKDSQFERIIATVGPPAALAYDRVEGMEDQDVAIKVQQSARRIGGGRSVEITLEGEKGKPLRTGMAGLMFFTIEKDARPQMVSRAE